MRFTGAPNGIVLGFLVGVATSSAALGILVAIVGSIVGWYAIIAIERLVGRGAQAGFTALSKQYQNAKRKDETAP
ncbi:hypothetical protein [Antrihabitans cavernicola]|uniref:Uncharacterized protein n=1 Tax=Antrihabitans cavernicola TaxID=2495913 RepID=A0A5A7S8M5_9NOCA|nr:hypothetical protein [Spelaeibacter cavernicola]KAA0018534.1 hypothetical protein FOY51_23950 [Spelaeibacter cavernicola]